MEKVSLWWDLDGCPLPSHMDPFVVRSMASSLLESFNIRGSGIGHQFSAYKCPSAKEDDIELGQTMFNSAIHLQLVQPGYGNGIEKMMMADMLLWAIDVRPPGDIILIVGNLDLSYVIRKLRERSYNVFLVCSSIAQVPPGMFSAANECLGWLTFLQLLEQNEEKLQVSSNVQGWGPEYYQAFSPAYKGSSSTVSSKELEEYQTRSSFGYISENSFTGQSSFNDGWDSSHPPLNGGWDSSYPPINGGWDSSHPPLNEASTSRVQHPQGPGFQWHGNKSTENPMDPAENKHTECKRPTDTKSKKKVASMGEFKAWLRQTVNSKENENGYNISPIRKDFEKARGKILDFAFLGFPKVLNLLDQCNDIAEVKEVKMGCHLAFPVKTHKENPHKTKKPNPNHKPTKGKPESSRAGMNTNHNTQPHLNPKPKPTPQKEAGRKPESSRAGMNTNHNTQPHPNPKPKPTLQSEAEHKSMPKATERDFYLFLLHMVSTGEFAQGFLMSQLRQKFESVSGKCLDVQHLGYQKLTNLVEVYSNLVSLDKTDGGHQRVYPAGSVRETVLNPNLCREGEEILFNMVDNVTKQEAKLEVDHPSTTISVQTPENNAWKDSISCKNLYNLNSELAVTEREWPSMDLSTSTFVSLAPTEPFMDFNEVNVCKQEAKAEMDNPSARGSISSWAGMNTNHNTQPHLNPKPKPKPQSEAEHKSMPKASERDFYFFLLHMVSTGEFAQGFPMSQLRQKFESVSGKCLDVQHLGYQKLTNLVEVYSNVVSLDKTGGGHQRVYPAGSVRETVLNPNLCRESEENLFNMVDNVTEQEAKLEVDHPSTSISVQTPENNAWKDSISCKNLYNLNSELAVTEREWPSMGLSTSTFMSLAPTEPFMDFNEVNVCKQEAKAEVDNPSARGSIRVPENKGWQDNISYNLLSYPNSELAVTESEWPSTLPFVSSTLTEPLMGFQDYSNKSDSSGTPQGSQVSELEGQFSKMTSENSSGPDSCQLERSEYVKQSLSNLQREGYTSTGNAAKNETLQNMRENTLFCKEVIRGSEIITNQNSSCGISFDRELSDSLSSQLEPPLKELKVTCDIPLALSPLQSLPQESVVCSKTLQNETRLDSKQNEQKAKSAVNEEGNVHSVVSPAESIMQVAGRGLKSIYEFSMWRKGQ